MRGSIVELRVGGLRPNGQGGQRYAAQVRCVAECGCESGPSSPGWSPALGGSATRPDQQATHGSPILLPAVAPVMPDMAAPSPLGATAAASPTAPAFLPLQFMLEPQQQQQQQQQQQPQLQQQTTAVPGQAQWLGFTQPEGFATAVGVPSWTMTTPSVAAMQPTAVALYSQALDPSPTGAGAMTSPAAAATLAAAVAANDLSQKNGGPPVPPPMALPLADVVPARPNVQAPVPSSAVPPELTGCEDCLLLD